MSRSLVAALVVFVYAAPGILADETWRILDNAKRVSARAEGQVAALVELAWPAEGVHDPVIGPAAREEIVKYGHDALAALRRLIPTLQPRFQADATAAFIEARFRKRQGIPPDFLPGLEAAIWFGSIEARRVAIRDVARYSAPRAILPIIDAAYVDPELVGVAVKTLGRMRDPHARFYLNDVLQAPETPHRSDAAFALAGIGGTALSFLREAAQSTRPEVRHPAMDALLGVATVDDLMLLHEYLYKHPNDPLALRQAVRTRVEALEIALELKLEEEASPERP